MAAYSHVSKPKVNPTLPTGHQEQDNFGLKLNFSLSFYFTKIEAVIFPAQSNYGSIIWITSKMLASPFYSSRNVYFSQVSCILLVSCNKRNLVEVKVCANSQQATR